MGELIVIPRSLRKVIRNRYVHASFHSVVDRYHSEKNCQTISPKYGSHNDTTTPHSPNAKLQGLCGMINFSIKLRKILNREEFNRNSNNEWT
jgi:hypothetical protein